MYILIHINKKRRVGLTSYLAHLKMGTKKYTHTNTQRHITKVLIHNVQEGERGRVLYMYMILHENNQNTFN